MSATGTEQLGFSKIQLKIQHKKGIHRDIETGTDTFPPWQERIFYVLLRFFNISIEKMFFLCMFARPNRWALMLR
jgi:hypothetical protein